MKLNSWLIVWTDQLNCKIIFVHCGPIISILSSIFDLELQSEGEASSQYPSIFKHTAPVGVLQREWRNWNKIKTRLRFHRFLLCKYRFLSQNGYEFEFSTWPLTIQAPGVNNINSLRQFQYLIRQEKMLWELMKWSPGKLRWSLIKFSIQFLKEKYGEQSRDFSSFDRNVSKPQKRYLFRAFEEIASNWKKGTFFAL